MANEDPRFTELCLESPHEIHDSNLKRRISSCPDSLTPDLSIAHPLSLNAALPFADRRPFPKTSISGRDSLDHRPLEQNSLAPLGHASSFSGVRSLTPSPLPSELDEDGFVSGRAFRAFDPGREEDDGKDGEWFDERRSVSYPDSISIASSFAIGSRRELASSVEEPPGVRPRFVIATGDDDDDDDDDGAVAMKRKVSLWEGVALMAGGIVGSGIFVSPTGVIRHAHSVGVSLLVWFLGGIITLVGAACYAELSGVVPKSGGEYAYLLTAYKGTGPWWFGELPAFMYCWVSLTLLKPAAFAIITKVFATYLVAPFFGGCEPSALLLTLVAVTAQIVITACNCVSVRGALRMQIVFTLTKSLALLTIIVAGGVMLSRGYDQNLRRGFEGSDQLSANSFALALYQCLWAYDGWNYLNYVTEEIVNPSRNILAAMLVSVPVVTLVYVLTNVAYFTVLSPYEVLHIGAVGIGFADRAMPTVALVVPLLIAASCFGAANTACFTSGRIYFAAGREGHAIRTLSMVTRRFHTPMPALILQCLISVAMNALGGVDQLIRFFSFVAWMFYGLTTLGVIVLRVTRPDAPRPFRVPLAFPVVFVLVCAYLVMAPIVEDPRIEFLWAFLFVVAGLFLYIPFGIFKVHNRFHFLTQPLLFFEYLMDLGESLVAADDSPTKINDKRESKTKKKLKTLFKKY